MELIRGQHNLRPRHRGCVATIGNFDGVHLGHRLILDQLADQAAQLRLPRLVITFEPQPQEFFAGPNAPPARLMRLREKLLALEDLGIERVLCLEFDHRLAAMPAEAFIDDLLVERLGVRHLVIGDDFRFGHRRAGNFDLLVEAGQRHGFTVADSHSHSLDGERVSSTRIRQALARGDLELAARLLGRPYDLCGRVAHGDRRGRTIGFPTANIAVWSEQLVPANGVYAGWATVGGEHYMAVTNVGLRPTFEGDSLRVEAHLLDFNRDIYGETMNFSFETRLRPEKKFNGIQELMAQIALDAQAGRDYLTANPHP